MPFGILKATGEIDKSKTKKLKKQVHKSCDKISKTLFEEISKVRQLAEGEKLSSHFWGSLSYAAFLYFSETNTDMYVSAEIADLFASEDLADPAHHIHLVDIERLEKVRFKELEKQAKKKAGQSK